MENNNLDDRYSNQNNQGDKKSLNIGRLLGTIFIVAIIATIGNYLSTPTYDEESYRAVSDEIVRMGEEDLRMLEGEDIPLRNFTEEEIANFGEFAPFMEITRETRNEVSKLTDEFISELEGSRYLYISDDLFGEDLKYDLEKVSSARLIVAEMDEQLDKYEDDLYQISEKARFEARAIQNVNTELIEAYISGVDEGQMEIDEMFSNMRRFNNALETLLAIVSKHHSEIFYDDYGNIYSNSDEVLEAYNGAYLELGLASEELDRFFYESVQETRDSIEEYSLLPSDMFVSIFDAMK